MTNPVTFLDVDDVLRIHSRMIGEFGGAADVRDHGLLQSSVLMPQARFGGELLHKSVSEMSAAYLYHNCSNHPFADGNKRTALAAAEMFILLNGHRLTATNKELEVITRSVAEGKQSKQEVTSFFRAHLAAPS